MFPFFAASEGRLFAALLALAKSGPVYSHIEISVLLCKHENLPVRM